MCPQLQLQLRLQLLSQPNSDEEENSENEEEDHDEDDEDDDLNDKVISSKYDLTAFLPTFDTGECVKSAGNDSYCEACVDLGYGSTKCMWCNIDDKGKEACIHERPDEY